MSRRKMVAALRQFFEVDSHKTFVTVKSSGPAGRGEGSGGACH